jgi:hypothetical protein
VTAEDPMMRGATTVFVVTDIAKSTEHYRDVLRFILPRLTMVRLYSRLDPFQTAAPRRYFILPGADGLPDLLNREKLGT